MTDSTEYFGKPAPPATRTCDWCGKPGVKAVEVFKPGKKVGTGQYVYPCSKHVTTAKRAVQSVRAPVKRAA
jgi:hypothetical protein